MKQGNLLIGVLSLTAIAGGLVAGSHFMGSLGPDRPPEIHGTALPEPAPLPAFELIDQDENPYTNNNLRDVWTLIYFGYTFCPDVCPLTLQQLASMEKLLEEQSVADGVAYTFISVDPQRDTPDRLGQYATFFSPNFRGVTGSEQQLENLAGPLGILFVKVEGSDAVSYLMDHSSVVLVVNPKGELQALFSAPHDGATMAADFVKLREAYRG